MRNTSWHTFGICVALAFSIGLAGCKKDEAVIVEKTEKDEKSSVAVDNDRKPIVAQSVSRLKPLNLLPFKDAVILSTNPPEGEKQPPNKTSTGKNAIKIFETIANELWDKANFTDDTGKRVQYKAVMTTEMGEVHLDLFGDAAPNHVRSFVCLARSGYYDGMSFYYAINRKVEENTVAYIEAGCPRGTGEFGSGSIGYWLRPEISDKLTHDEGVIGACLGEDPESAACRFYITAASIPLMDGRFTIFGKVTRGLDIVRTINKREVLENDRLQQPVLIKGVKIQPVPE